MSNWIVIDKHMDAGDVAGLVFSLGIIQDYHYTVENEETGERKLVAANDRYELGERISEGDFEDVEEDEGVEDEGKA